MWIDRTIAERLKNRLFSGKAIILTGPRQVGKSSLIGKVLEGIDRKKIFFDGDDPTVRQILDTPNTPTLQNIIGDAEIIFVDEAQRISNIGLTAKIIVDQFKDKQLILSGSSTLDLHNAMQEPLTGRKWTFDLFPISWEEYQDSKGYFQATQNLENRLIYGFYPDVISNPSDQEEVLQELVDSYLFKDVLAYDGIRKPEFIRKLVQALAFQVGQEVSYREVSQITGIDPKTVEKYIEVLEKSYVIFRLPAFSRNLRNEIKASRKIYFYDNGVRNALIGAYQPFKLRNDTGHLWENFLVSERRKQLSYKKIQASTFFWRTKQQQEIDFIEERSGKISAFEFKLNPSKKIKFPQTFANNYDSDFFGINSDNFREFVIIDLP